MPESGVTVRVNGKSVPVPPGATAAVAILTAGAASRTSVTGEPRMPFCGMGTCFECCAEINGQPYQRSCQILCEAGMEIRTNGFLDVRPF
jgi:predicted molibdopterin-dependent oxidoreductase YjgC